MDDVDLNLSDDDEDTIDMPAKETGGAVVKPVLFVVCMVVPLLTILVSKNSTHYNSSVSTDKENKELSQNRRAL